MLQIPAFQVARVSFLSKVSDGLAAQKPFFVKAWVCWLEKPKMVTTYWMGISPKPALTGVQIEQPLVF